MEITKADLELRLADLRAQFEKLQANAHALGGAMQDCQYWITIVDGQDAQTTTIPTTGGSVSYTASSTASGDTAAEAQTGAPTQD